MSSTKLGNGFMKGEAFLGPDTWRKWISKWGTEGALETKETERCVLYGDGECGLGPFRVLNEGRIIPDGAGDSASLVLEMRHKRHVWSIRVIYCCNSFFFLPFLFMFIYLFVFFSDTVSLCCSGWVGTHDVEQAGLELMEICLPLLRIKAWVYIFKNQL